MRILITMIYIKMIMVVMMMMMIMIMMIMMMVVMITMMNSLERAVLRSLITTYKLHILKFIYSGDDYTVAERVALSTN